MKKKQPDRMTRLKKAERRAAEQPGPEQQREAEQREAQAAADRLAQQEKENIIRFGPAAKCWLTGQEGQELAVLLNEFIEFTQGWMGYNDLYLHYRHRSGWRVRLTPNQDDAPIWVSAEKGPWSARLLELLRAELGPHCKAERRRQSHLPKGRHRIR